MLIGEDVALRVDNESGAGSPLFEFGSFKGLRETGSEEIPEEPGHRKAAAADLPDSIDIDDGGSDLLSYPDDRVLPVGDRELRDLTVLLVVVPPRSGSCTPP